jgi:UTP:GlnB (protein PII) uridylyltransferase
VRQFFGALRPCVTGDERTGAYRYLSERERALFETMTVRDQQHGIVVCARVRAAASGDDRALFAAALLHDCGKGRVMLWQRVAHVVLGATAPGLERRIASEHGFGSRRAFWRLIHHPRLGAELAAAAGADPDVVRMIRDQDAPQADTRLALLQAADGQ